MKKNILSYGLSAIVLLSVLAMVMPVSAQVKMADEFGVENAMGDSNTYVEVPVNITNTANGPISDIGFYLHYNENVLNLTNERIMRVGLASDWPFILPDKEKEGVYFIGLRAKGIPAVGIDDGTSIGDGITGSVVLLNFSVVGGPGTSSYMNLSEVTMKNVSGELGTTALAKNGTFTVTGAPAPDTTEPTTNVTTPEMAEEPSPIPTGHELNWTNEDVNISFRRTDNDGGNPSGVNYTNLSAETQITNVDINGTTMTIPQIGTGNLTINTTTFGETFNVTISDELNTKIYYYSVDKNDTANVEDTKNLTVRIDKTAPDIISVELNKTSVNASEQINVSVSVIDPQNGEVASGVANVTADGVELTKQDGNWWNGTITAAASGLHNVTVTAYDNASNTATNDTVQYEVQVIAEITAFGIENPTAGLGQNFTARINVNTTENATAGWYVVVVSGVNETTGEGLAGIGTVRMVKNDFVENMPVLVHIPPVTTLGDYELYAGLYRLEDYPSKLENILDHEGPKTVTVT
ncbi:MAG: hypothetical protein WBD09_08415 [Halobacteriota archaeon]